MTEQQVLDIIIREFRALRLQPPEGIERSAKASPQATAWLRAARCIVSECDSDNRRAARTASMAGAMITRGRTRL